MPSPPPSQSTAAGKHTLKPKRLQRRESDMSAIALRKEPGLRLAESHPIYELRVTSLTATEIEVSVWQLPSVSTPRLQQAERTASLAGRPWRMIEARVSKRLHKLGISVAHVKRNQTAAFSIDE